MTNEQLYQEMQNYQEDLESGEEEVTEVSSLEVLHVWKYMCGNVYMCKSLM